MAHQDSSQTSTPIALTIAGSDSGGGAGIQADLKAFSAMGAYGASVITALTAQNTRAVTAVHGVPIDMIRAQLDAVFDDLAVNAVKIGMLATPEIIITVADNLKGRDVPIVLDPVMVAKSGDALLADEAVATLKSELLPLATVLTPNLPEAARLLDTSDAHTRERFEQQYRQEREARESMFRSVGVDTIDVTTAEPYVDPLMRFFRMRATKIRA